MRRHSVDTVIEPGGRGATYHHATGFSVYRLDTYPRTSVLAGQQRRVFVDHYQTLAEAQAANPGARLLAGTSYQAPSLHHLSDDGDA